MKHFDEVFILHCIRGDKKLQKQLFEELYTPMFRICMRYLAHHADAEDCVMLGLMKVFQNLDRFSYAGEQSLFIWTRKIIVNEALMFIRKKQNLLFALDDMSCQVSIQPDIIHALEAEALNFHIMQLPPGYRTVFNLNVVEGYEHKEIASMLNISEVTSRTQLAKAKNKLKQMLTSIPQQYGKDGK